MSQTKFLVFHSKGIDIFLFLHLSICCSTHHNYCRLLCLLLVTLKVTSANSVDPDQTAPLGVRTVCLYAKIGLKSLQEYSADDINRRHFQMQVFLAL